MAEPVVPESHDLLIKPKSSDEPYKRVQVKTCRVRKNRNAIIVRGTKDDGTPYTKEDTDFLLGVLDDKAYMFECTGLTEYWATLEGAAEKWEVLPVNLKEVS